MDTLEAKSFRPTDRDYEILQHLSRYHLITREVLHSQFFVDTDISAVSKVTTRLCDAGWLSRHEFADRVFFVAGPVGLKFLNVSRKPKAIGPQSFIDNYAFQQFCFCCDTPRERLRVGELAKILGDISGKKLKLGMFYLDFEQGRRLAALRVDHGSDAAHILRRTRTHIEHLVGNPKIAELVHRREFLMSIVTFRDEKKLDIDDAIARQSWPVAFKVEVVPGLASVVAHAMTQRQHRRGGAN